MGNNGFLNSELDTTIRTLETLRYFILNGDFDGWGLDDNMVLCVKSWLENVRDGVYSDQKYQIKFCNKNKKSAGYRYSDTFSNRDDAVAMLNLLNKSLPDFEGEILVVSAI